MPEPAPDTYDRYDMRIWARTTVTATCLTCEWRRTGAGADEASWRHARRSRHIVRTATTTTTITAPHEIIPQEEHAHALASIH